MLMRRLTVILSLVLVACRQEQADLQSDYAKIVHAVLEQQYDLTNSYEEMIAEYPETEGFISGWLDHRYCVARMTRGLPEDYDWQAGELGDDWKDSDIRQVIPRSLLPNKLRWDSIFRICPNGVLKLSNPSIDGDEALLHVENECGGWCGSGVVYRLRRIDGKWIVEEERLRWVA